MQNGGRFGVLLCALALVLGTGCKQEEQVPPDAVHTVDLEVAFVFTYGTHGYELASEYTDVQGHLYKLDRIRFLLSGLDVVDDGNNVLATYGDKQLLVDAGQPSNVFPLGSLTASHAHQIRFTMGLDGALNNADPDTCAAPMNDASMHWGMGAEEGYWFLVLEGRVDSDNSGAIEDTDAPFSYRCGGDALKRHGWAVMHQEIPNGGTLTVETPVDVERLMGGVDVLNNLTAHGGSALNAQLMDSLEINFRESH